MVLVNFWLLGLCVDSDCFMNFLAARVLNLVVFFIMTGLGCFKEPNSLGLWRRQMYLLLNFGTETRLTDCVLGLG